MARVNLAIPKIRIAKKNRDIYILKVIVFKLLKQAQRYTGRCK